MPPQINGSSSDDDCVGEKSPLILASGEDSAEPGKNSGGRCGESSCSSLSTGTKRFIVGVVFGSALAVMIGVAIFHPRRPNSGSSQRDTTDAGDAGRWFEAGKGKAAPASNEYSGDDPFLASPIDDMNMLTVERGDDAAPSKIWGNHLMQGKLPTNSWYLNLVSHRAAYQPDDQTRVYTVPYIVDTAPSTKGMAGIRVHWPIVQASSNNVQMVSDFKNALCLGSISTTGSLGDESYRVIDSEELSPLGVGIEWGSDDDSAESSGAMMWTHIVRGMPYATMSYGSSTAAVPAIYSYNGLASDVQIDLESSSSSSNSSSTTAALKCGIEGGAKGNVVDVSRHLHLHFINSDFTWMVFFNKPVKVSCQTNKEEDPKLRDFKLTVHAGSGNDNDDADRDLVVRVALLNQCTTGKATIKEHCMERNAQADLEGYEQILISNARVMPRNPAVDFDYGGGSRSASIDIDWDASSTSADTSADEEGIIDANDDLLMFAMPHHQAALSLNTGSSNSTSNVTDYCVHTFHGNTCLVQSSKWKLVEDLGSPLSFNAPRPPLPGLIPKIAEQLRKDIRFHVSENTMRGAADTYFSGKIVSRLARIVVISSELSSLASAVTDGESEDSSSSFESLLKEQYDSSEVDVESVKASALAASKVKLPSAIEMDKAIKQLKGAVTAWLRSNAEAPYLYDKTWGGLINCGCSYVGHGEKGYCNNTFPNCPALLSVNNDFGNAYYNDHHYHYGYHVYAASVAAKLDPEWGRQHFEEILLYIRDFANPRSDDPHFPQYRQKDWYLGSSWASGIVSAENSPHGRNEESSSEAISAYEGVTLFGTAMVSAFKEVLRKSGNGDDDKKTRMKLESAKLIRDSGQLLTSTEISATNRYWHLWESDDRNNTSYPSAYTQPVVGMLYDTMATFQTWFAPWAVVSMGIQLIPLTPVAETRDDVEWARQLYPLYDKACKDAGDFCVDNGWSILQAGLLATAGGSTINDTDSNVVDEAVKQAMAVPVKVFSTDGGIGNSMTNTLWYIATRKETASENGEE